MFKKILNTIVISGLGLFCSNQAMAKCNPDPCPEGQTCRYEQPNTYQCKPYNNVAGAQGEFDQQSSRPGIPQGRFESNRPGQKFLSGCGKAQISCVDIRINGRPYSAATVTAAVQLAMITRLRGERLASLQVIPNEAALAALRNQRGALGRAMSRASAFRFVERPNLPDIKNIHDLMPPLDFMTRVDPMLGANLAQLEAQYGFAAMQAAIAEIKNLALGSGGNLAPVLFGATAVELLVGAAAAAKIVESGISLFNWLTSDDEEDGDKKGEKKKGGESGNGPGEGGIIAETEWPMGIAAYNTYRLMVTSWNRSMGLRF